MLYEISFALHCFAVNAYEGSGALELVKLLISNYRKTNVCTADTKSWSISIPKQLAMAGNLTCDAPLHAETPAFGFLCI